MLPIFNTHEDPGPSFVNLLDKMSSGSIDHRQQSRDAEIVHGTTCVALRYDEGVVLAGDRRATAGNLIAHSHIEKVFAADSHSGVAIAGAAGPAVDMVKMFQLQLEHYEKVEGSQLSLEGKANQLANMIKGHLPAAMSGMAVVPLFAGYDVGRNIGRLFQYDITGGRYEESDYAATGSGSLHGGTVIKMGYRDELTADSGIDLVLRALWEAADADSATGGPDLVRNIFPIVATISASGFERIADSDLHARTERLIDVLREQRGYRDIESVEGTGTTTSGTTEISS